MKLNWKEIGFTLLIVVIGLGVYKVALQPFIPASLQNYLPEV